jgi:hypothetical protein
LVHTVHHFVVMDFFFVRSILLGKYCSVSLLTDLSCAWKLVTFCSSENFVNQPYTDSPIFSLHFVTAQFNTVTFRNIWDSFIYHLFILFRSTRYICNSWSSCHHPLCLLQSAVHRGFCTSWPLFMLVLFHNYGM